MKIKRQQIINLIRQAVIVEQDNLTDLQTANVADVSKETEARDMFKGLVKSNSSWLAIRNDIANIMNNHTEWTSIPNRPCDSNSVTTLMGSVLGLNAGGVEQALVDSGDILVDMLCVACDPSKTTTNWMQDLNSAVTNWASDNDVGSGQGIVSRDIPQQERPGAQDELYAEEEPQPDIVPESKMKIDKETLNKIIHEEIENLTYKLKKSTVDDALSHDHPSEVKTQEDAFAGGANIVSNVDHLKDGGYPEKTQVGIERHNIAEGVKKISRGALRRLVQEASGDYDLDAPYFELVADHILILFRKEWKGVAKYDAGDRDLIDYRISPENKESAIITIELFARPPFGNPKAVLRRFKKSLKGKAGINLEDEGGLNNVANRAFKMSLVGNNPVRWKGGGDKKQADGFVTVFIRVKLDSKWVKSFSNEDDKNAKEKISAQPAKGDKAKSTSTASIKGKVFAGKPRLKSKYKVENDDMNINNIVVSVVEYPRDPKAVGRKFKLGKIDDDHALKVNVRKAWDKTK